MFTKCSFIERGDLRVLEALVLHHMTPVAGGIADREEDRFILGTGLFERDIAPGIPIDGIGGVLEQVGAGFAGQAIALSWSFRT